MCTENKSIIYKIAFLDCIVRLLQVGKPLEDTFDFSIINVKSFVSCLLLLINKLALPLAQ